MSAAGGGGGILLRQIRHELRTLLRTPITLILSIGFPLVFFVLISTLVGNETMDSRAGVRVVQFLAPAFASFGVVMATFSFLAVGLAESRATGVLKRQTGTPLPRWALIGGRIGAAVLLGLIATAIVFAVGAVFYDLQLYARTIGAVVLTLLLASFTFSALGIALALLLPSPQITLAVTNGIVIPLAFVSDIFTFGGSLPSWMADVGWFFPLKHLVNLLADGLNPYLDGSGFQLDHLAVILAWGVAGALAAIWALRAEREGGPARAPGARGGARPGDTVPRRTAPPSAATLLREQVAHTQAILWRDPSSVFFAVVFPVVLVAIIPTINGGGDLRLDNGQLLGTFFAATMAIYGAAVTAYVNMPQVVAEDRERSVLKRTRATPLPPWAFVAGRIVGALVVALLTLAAVAVLAAVMYSPPVPPNWPVAVLVFVFCSVAFAVLGLAVASLVHSAEAVTGVALGTLLPLSFVSEIFVVGADLPPVLDAIGWFFPLRHAARAMTWSISDGASGLPLGHLGVVLAWTAVAAVVVALRFRWESVKDTRAAAARAGRPAEVAA